MNEPLGDQESPFSIEDFKRDLDNFFRSHPEFRNQNEDQVFDLVIDAEGEELKKYEQVMKNMMKESENRRKRSGRPPQRKSALAKREVEEPLPKALGVITLSDDDEVEILNEDTGTMKKSDSKVEILSGSETDRLDSSNDDDADEVIVTEEKSFITRARIQKKRETKVNEVITLSSSEDEDDEDGEIQKRREKNLEEVITLGSSEDEGDDDVVVLEDDVKIDTTKTEGKSLQHGDSRSESQSLLRSAVQTLQPLRLVEERSPGHSDLNARTDESPVTDRNPASLNEESIARAEILCDEENSHVAKHSLLPRTEETEKSHESPSVEGNAKATQNFSSVPQEVCKAQDPLPSSGVGSILDSLLQTKKSTEVENLRLATESMSEALNLSLGTEQLSLNEQDLELVIELALQSKDVLLSSIRPTSEQQIMVSPGECTQLPLCGSLSGSEVSDLLTNDDIPDSLIGDAEVTEVPSAEDLQPSLSPSDHSEQSSSSPFDMECLGLPCGSVARVTESGIQQLKELGFSGTGSIDESSIVRVNIPSPPGSCISSISGCSNLVNEYMNNEHVLDEVDLSRLSSSDLSEEEATDPGESVVDSPVSHEQPDGSATAAARRSDKRKIGRPRNSPRLSEGSCIPLYQSRKPMGAGSKNLDGMIPPKKKAKVVKNASKTSDEAALLLKPGPAFCLRAREKKRKPPRDRKTEKKSTKRPAIANLKQPSQSSGALKQKEEIKAPPQIKQVEPAVSESEVIQRRTTKPKMKPKNPCYVLSLNFSECIPRLRPLKFPCGFPRKSNGLSIVPRSDKVLDISRISEKIRNHV